MEIISDDLDARIAELAAMPAAAPDSTSSPAVPRLQGGGCVLIGLIFATPIFAAFLGTLINSGLGGLFLALLIVGIAAMGVSAVAGKVRKRRRQRRPGEFPARAARRRGVKRVPVSAETLRALADRTNLSAAERAYCSTLALLAESDPQRTGLNPETLRADLLQPLAALLKKSRDLSKKEQDVDRALAAGAVQKLTVEQCALQKRRDAVGEDDMAREAADQALAMNESRLADARAFEQMRERLGVQQEAAAQTLASVASSLARANLSDAQGGRAGLSTNDAAEFAAPGGVAEINQAIRAIAGQTQAVARAEAELRGVHS